MTRSLSFVCAAALVLFLTSNASAQFNARLQGTVSDATGAVIPGATVTLTNKETNKSQTVQSDPSGVYTFNALPPGTYSLKAELQGFNTFTQDNITIAAEQSQSLNVTLQPGAVTQSVTVTAPTVASLDTENANIGTELINAQVTHLPQFARNPYNLIMLSPNVTMDAGRSGNGQAVNLPNTTGPGGSNSSIFQTENQVPVAANGQRISSNNFMIDGVSVNSLEWGGGAVVTPNQESIKSMVILTDPYSAEYGRNTGAQINVISQNGTNQFHGSGVFRYSDPIFNAYNSWGGPGGALPTRDNDMYKQFAASLGGPVIKNHLFFFFSYEGLRDNTIGYYTGWVETPQFRQAVLNARPNGLLTKLLNAPGSQPRIVSVLNSQCPSGFTAATCRVVGGGIDVGSFTGGIGQYTNTLGGGLDGIPDLEFAQFFNPSNTSGNQYNFRIDYNLGEKDTIAFSDYITRLNTLGGDTSSFSRPMADLVFNPLNTAGTLIENHIFGPTLLNQFRWNYTRFSNNQINSGGNVNWGIPRLEVQDYPISRVTFGAPQGTNTPAALAQNTFEFADILNLVHANHSFRYGGGVRWEQDNNNLAGASRPIYVFSGLWNLANDAPIFEGIGANPNTGGPANAQRYFRTRDYDMFFQDDWKVKPNLTLNLGLRWEYFSPLTETRGKLSNVFFPSAYNAFDARVGAVSGQLYNSIRTDFGPRFGFAYSPLGTSSNFVIRGGFGIFYDRLPDVSFTNTMQNPPFFAYYNICCGTASTSFGTPFANGQILYAFGSSNSPFSYPANPALAQGLNPVTGAPNNGAVSVYGAFPKTTTPYSYIYSMQLEYRMPWNFVASLGYSGSDTHHEVRFADVCFLYTCNSASYFAIYQAQTDVDGNYNALIATLTRQLTHGLQMQVNYRWSKSLDYLSYGGPGAVTNQTYPQNQATEYGPSDYDTPQFFLASAMWHVPTPRHHGLLGILTGGWELNPILTFHSGFPWTPKIGQSVVTPGGPTLAPIRPTVYYGGAKDDQSVAAWETGSNFPGGGAKYFDVKDTGFPGVGRNSFRGPHFFQTNVSVGKMTALPWLHLGEAAELELRMDVYNAFNQTNLLPLGFFSQGTMADQPFFGIADGAMAGRVVQIQARFSF